MPVGSDVLVQKYCGTRIIIEDSVNKKDPYRADSKYSSFDTEDPYPRDFAYTNPITRREIETSLCAA
jgi:hypothetical protein